MRHIACTEVGSPELLSLVEASTPSPSPDEVLVEVEYAGVGFVDALLVNGGYQTSPPLPFTPGSVVAGRVAALGDGVTGPAVGTRVIASLPALGGFSSHTVVPSALTFPLPDGVPADIAAAALGNYCAVVFAVTHRLHVGAGEHVVVLGAGGGIGLAAVDVARSLGARVVAVASSAEKRDAAKGVGADAAIDYTDLKKGIVAATDGGADVVFDPVGGAAAESSLRALRPGGRLCVLGFTSGDIPRLPANQVLLRNRTVVGVELGGWLRDTARPGDYAALIADVLGRIAREDLRPATPTAVPLAEAGALLRKFVERQATGSYVLVP